MAVVFAHLVPEPLRPVGEPVLTDKLFRVPLAGELEVSIRVFTSEQPEASNLFEFFLVRPRHHAQQQVVELKQKATNKRLGYLYPLAALGPDSTFTKWPGVFAHAAVDWILTTEFAKDLLTISQIEDITPEKGRSIVDCFDPTLGVVVLSKQGLGDAACGADSLRLMIQEHGIRPISARGTPPDTDAEPQFEPHLHLRKCSAHITDELDQFCFLLEVADQQSYLPARLLILYQIVEAFIARVFEQAASALVSDSAMLRNIWELRERLDELSREKSRINLLFSDYIDDKSREVHAATIQLKDACVSFLRKVEPIVAPPPAAAPAADPAAPGPAAPLEAPPVAGAVDAPPETAPASDPAEELPSTASDTAAIAAAGAPDEALEDAPPVVEPPPAPDVLVVELPASLVAGAPPAPAPAQAGVKQDLAEKHWSDLLYRTRNLLVHRQWQMKKVPEKELSDVCAALEQLLYLAVSGFLAEPKGPAAGVATA